MIGASRALRPFDQDTEAHGARSCGNHADNLTCSPRAASYQTSGRSHTATGVVGNGMFIQGPTGLMHAKPGPVTEIYLVCSASAAMRAQPRPKPPGTCSVLVRLPGPAAKLKSETAALAPRPTQLRVVAP